MSRYLILVILNAPFIIAGLTNSLVSYKLSHISGKRLAFQICFWIVLFSGLASAKWLYEFLFSNNLTATEPLSLFDVFQITGIIGLSFLVIRLRGRLDGVERRFQELHRELSIKLSEDQSPPAARATNRTR